MTDGQVIAELQRIEVECKQQCVWMDQLLPVHLLESKILFERHKWNQAPDLRTETPEAFEVRIDGLQAEADNILRSLVDVNPWAAEYLDAKMGTAWNQNPVKTNSLRAAVQLAT